jgi:hypothetical protein
LIFAVEVQNQHSSQEHLHRDHHIEASAITKEVLQMIYGKDRLTLEEKWGAIYIVLFPQARVIPCPCEQYTFV